MLNIEKNSTPLVEMDLVGLLKVLGHEPLFVKGSQYFYAAVFDKRKSDNQVFIVNQNLDFWFDRTLGRGGNMDDFASLYWPELSRDGIKQQLETVKLRFKEKASRLGKPRRKRKSILVPYYLIQKTGSLGFNEELNNFLRKEGLWELADPNMKEVYYYSEDRFGKRRNFCAIGWQNENGGWEVRAQNYKGCIGPKGMTLIAPCDNVLTVFPDYIDYLRNRNSEKFPLGSVLILNHPHFLLGAIKRARRFKRTLFFSDRKQEDTISMALKFKEELSGCELVHF